MPIFFVKPRKEDVPGTGDTTVDPPIPSDQVEKYDVFREGKSTPEATFGTDKEANRKMEELEEAEAALAPVSSEASTQEAPTDAPVNTPTDAPVNAPTDAPVNTPTDAPVNPPAANTAVLPLDRAGFKDRRDNFQKKHSNEKPTLPQGLKPPGGKGGNKGS